MDTLTQRSQNNKAIEMGEDKQKSRWGKMDENYHASFPEARPKWNREEASTLNQSQICVLLVAQKVKHMPTMWETWIRFLGWEDPLEKEMATHPSIHAYKIPWANEPGGLQSIGSQRVGHDWGTSLHFTCNLAWQLVQYYILWFEVTREGTRPKCVLLQGRGRTNSSYKAQRGHWG